jgi:hypothetical protein
MIRVCISETLIPAADSTATSTLGWADKARRCSVNATGASITR